MATRYRQLEAPASLQTGLVDNSAARLAQSLSQSFGEFSDTAFTLGGTLRTQQGAREGEAAGAAGTPDPRTGLAATTRYGAAYNGAAEVSYANKVSIDLAEQLDRIEREAETDPILYDEKTRGLVEGTLADAPVEWRTRLEQHIVPRVQAGAMRVARATDLKRKRETLADYLAAEPVAVSQLVRTLRELPGEAGDAELARVVAERSAQIDAMLADNVIDDPVQAEKMRQAFTEKVDAALFADRTGSMVEELVATARDDVEQADEMLLALDAREDLTLEEKTAIRGAYREQSELLRFERTRAHMDDLANLSKRLAAGEFNGIRSEAGRLYRRGALSPAEYEQYVGAAERNRQAEIEKDAHREAFEVVNFIDPANPDHQKAAEQFFTDQTKIAGMAPGDERWRAFAINMVQQRNILPKSAESWARVALLSSDPIVATQAADFMSRVRQAKPNAYAWNNEPKLDALASSLKENMAAGLDPVPAYELARRTTWDLKDSEAKVLTDEYTQLTRKDPNSGVLDDVLNDAYTDLPGWQSKLPVPLGAKAEYEALVRQYFVLSQGSIEKARKRAGEILLTTWGVDTVNGKPEFVKYPPSRLVPTEIIRADIATLVEPLGIDPAKARLVRTEATDRTKGLNWGIGYTDELGMDEIVLGPDNRPRPYQLPVGQGFAEAREASRRQNKARARLEREAEEKAEAERRAVMRADSRTPGLR